MPTNIPDGDNPDILKYVDEVIERENKKMRVEQKKRKLEDQKRALINSYGAVVLDNNMIINVKKNFYFLEQLWLQWIYAKEFEMEPELQKLKEATNGGLFNSGDMIFKLDHIKMIMKPQVYYDSSADEKENVDLKNAMTNTYVGDSIYNQEGLFYSQEENDDFEPEEEEEE